MPDIFQTITGGFFDSVNQDRLYNADQMNMPYKKIVSDGLFFEGGDGGNVFKVTAAGGMTVNVGPGNALIGGKWAENEDALTVDISGNTSESARVDSIILRLDANIETRAVGIVYRQGAAAAPALDTSDGVKEFRLANITVSVNAVAVTDTNISDTRGTADCPWVTSLIYPSDAQMKAGVGAYIGDNPGALIPAIEGGVAEWMEAHPEATTTVLDGSLTEAKFSNALKLKAINGYATPEMYGAAGDGTTDDTEAVQNALNQGGLIIFGNKKLYSVGCIRVKAFTEIDLNGAVIICTELPSIFNFEDTDAFTGYNGNGNIIIKNGEIRGGTVSFIHGENILFENVVFKNTLGNHSLEICACKNLTVNNCVFSGMSHTGGTREYINFDQCDSTAFPWLPSGNAGYDGTVNKNIKILNNFFDKGETGYTDCQWAMGCHYVADTTKLHEDVVISGNTIEGYMSNCIRLQAFKNSVVEGNTLTSAGRPFYVGYGNNNRIVNNYALVSANSAFAGFTAPEESIYIDGNSIAAEDNRAFVTRTFAAGTLTGVTFKKLQKSYIGAAESGELQTDIPLTSLHKVTAFVGTLENANARWVTIEAYPDRKFQLGESYAYLNIDNSMNIAARNFTIDSEDGTKATTTTTFRYVYGEV